MNTYKFPLCGLALAAVLNSAAQAPPAFSYQAVARDSVGQPYQYHTLSVRIEILQTSVTGPVVYEEQHLTVTNQFGLFSLSIGDGDPEQGPFSDIDWSSGPYFVQVSLDLNGGTNFTILGTQQLLSVPYALYANQAGSSQPSGRNLSNSLALVQTLCQCSSIPPFLIQDALAEGYSVSDLWIAGASVTELSNAGVPVSDLLAGGVYPQLITSSSGLGFPFDSIAGKFYKGGIIAWIDQPTGRVLLAAPADQALDPQWGCQGLSISGATASTVFTGNNNTNAIVQACTTPGTAARSCSDLVLNGYSDWYLPSKTELNFLYVTLHQHGVGEFSASSYWSSTQADANSAWQQSFATGTQISTTKSTVLKVRAVREQLN